jgi:SpoVK/Ycf46/Vps4 family AAA+-type ATPase
VSDVDYTKRPRYVEIQEEIAALPGMRSVKGKVNRLVEQAMMNKARAAAGMPVEPTSNNMILTGNPGTGKTTVTRKMGELMFELGLSKSPQVVQLTRADLVGEFVNQAAENANKVLTKNRGKTIFIDEAYTLYNGPQDHEGRQVVDELMRLAEEYREDTPIILAGYEDEMDRMVAVNPGMKSRFPGRMDLPDYTPQEKAQVMHYIVGQANRTYESPAVKKRVAAYAASVPSVGEHGNARAVRNFYDAMREAQAARLMGGKNLTPQVLSTFTAEDADAAAFIMGLEPIRTVRGTKAPNPAARARREGYRRRVGSAGPGRKDAVVAGAGLA